MNLSVYAAVARAAGAVNLGATHHFNTRRMKKLLALRKTCCSEHGLSGAEEEAGVRRFLLRQREKILFFPFFLGNFTRNRASLWIKKNSACAVYGPPSPCHQNINIQQLTDNMTYGALSCLSEG